MASVDHTSLSSRIDELVVRFVDFDIPLDRGPTSEELDRIAAFKLLVHAELEGFVEARTTYAVDEALRLWKAQRKVTRALMMLALRWSAIDECRLSFGVANTEFDQQVERCAQRAREEIDANNGIKLEALQRLACSAGFLVDDLQATLTGAANSYGKDRGDVAHKPVGKVRSLNDPRAEAAAARGLVDELKAFDEHLLSFLS